MTASDKKKVMVLAGLLIVGAFAWYYVYSPSTGGSSTGSNKAPAKPSAAKPGQDAVIRVDILEQAKSINVGQKNLFQYGQRPAPKPPEPPPGYGNRPPVIANPQPAQPFVPPPPPQPQFRPFRYEGFSVSKGGGKILGSITEGGNTYEVKEGDCVMGQYCVTRLTESLIEIEDLQLKRRQSFTRTQ